jgi:hypothetical protein
MKGKLFASFLQLSLLTPTAGFSQHDSLLDCSLSRSEINGSMDSIMNMPLTSGQDFVQRLTQAKSNTQYLAAQHSQTPLYGRSRRVGICAIAFPATRVPSRFGVREFLAKAGPPRAEVMFDASGLASGVYLYRLERESSPKRSA